MKDLGTKRVLSIQEFEKRAKQLRAEIDKCYSKGNWSKTVTLMKEAEDLKQTMMSQQYSIEEVTEDEQTGKDLLNSVIKITVLCDILSGVMMEYKQRLAKARISQSDSYDLCRSITHLCSRLVKMMDNSGPQAALILEYFTEKIESKYMLGMDNEINNLINNTTSIEIPA